MTLTTTLNRIREHSPRKSRWAELLAGLGKTGPDDEVLPYEDILEINGLESALWCCRAEPQYDKEWRLFAVWCARQVQPLIRDPRTIVAIDVAERYANGLATAQELTLAREDAEYIDWIAALVTAPAAGDVAWIAALAARDVTTKVARIAVWDATAACAHFLEVVK